MAKRVLIISLGTTADTVYTLPLTNVLSDNNYIVDYVVSEKGFCVINRNPKVHGTFLASMEQWTGKWLQPETWEAFFKLVERIKMCEYDIVIDCQQDIRSLLIFAMCVGKRKITYSDAKGFSSIGSNEQIQSISSNMNMVERHLNILKYLHIEFNSIVFPLPDINYTFVLSNEKIFSNLDKTKKTIIISAGARNENKRWSASNWTTLISRIKDKYNLIFTGSTIDIPFTKEIGGEAFLNLCGETRIERFIDILKRGDIVITSDTETSALAWAVGNPRVITLFTCTSPEKYAPVDKNNETKYISLYGNLSCQPCGNGMCLDIEAKCRKYPTVEDVLRALE